MAYATLDQLVSLFGADEIRTLSDRQGTGELDEAVISDALERASSEVDSYLADRYATPLSDSDPIPPVVVSVAGDIEMCIRDRPLGVDRLLALRLLGLDGHFPIRLCLLRLSPVLPMRHKSFQFGLIRCV